MASKSSLFHPLFLYHSIILWRTRNLIDCLQINR
jgi:hypothetical protein